MKLAKTEKRALWALVVAVLLSFMPMVLFPSLFRPTKADAKPIADNNGGVTIDNPLYCESILVTMGQPVYMCPHESKVLCAGLTYQWRRGGKDIKGATSSIFTIVGALEDDGVSYVCEVKPDFIYDVPVQENKEK